jgi:predicted alpha/beta hydrolase family esterase
MDDSLENVRESVPCLSRTKEKPSILVVPGWANSGPDHWQSLWQRENAHWVRVEQSDWEFPEPHEWIAAVDQVDRYVRACPTPPVLLGHSLGCIAIVKWAFPSSLPIAGAFLVAPSDVEAVSAPEETQFFAPIPRTRLRFPAHLVCSDNDPFLSPAHAETLAD